ncbi:hypothetical protein KSP39_PZI006528 [Platanthera zijinensis]|uniref:Reverse transcriptase Ty1/copia-type domain-containing protein n=1 Tax=Platanthera zijinensis TaxID=2320716 RepID=A0AAP0BPH2_9ASPA
MLHTQVPKAYWNFALSTTCYLINRLPSPILHNVTPFSLMFPSTPAFSLTPRIFGCTCYVHILGPSMDKVDPRAAKHIFVGYSRTQKGYVCYSPATCKVPVSADVTFRKNLPFFSAPDPTPLSTSHPPPPVLRPVIPVTTPLPKIPDRAPTLSKPSLIHAYTRRHPGFCPNAVGFDLCRSASCCSGTRINRSSHDELCLDYEETFSPVAKLNTVRVLLSVAVHRHWPLHQLDIKNVFLNGDLQETVYMRQPPGFETTGESRVRHLKKSIYGLKQSPRACFDRFSKAVQEVDFTQSSAYFSLFTRHRATGTVLLLVYVDDILIIGDDSKGIQAVKQHLSSVFQTKDLGHLRYFLGLEVARRSDGLALSQRKYCLDLLQDAGYSGCKPTATPMDSNHKLCAHASDTDLPLQNPEYYQRLVGKLIYLTVTRADISFAVGVVSRFMHAPRISHLQAVERILRYLKTALGQGLVYKTASSIPTLVAYSDADYAGSLDDR